MKILFKKQITALTLILAIITLPFGPVSAEEILAEVPEEVLEEEQVETPVELPVESVDDENSSEVPEPLAEELADIPETEEITASTTEEVTALVIEESSATSTEATASTTEEIINDEVIVTDTPDVPADIASTTTASTTPDTPTIVTGQAVAMANILNIVNTNLINSSGAIIFSNISEDHLGDIDFRETTNPQPACQFLSCGDIEGVEVHLLNDAHIRNAIIIDANSGDNVIEASDGTPGATINTGDAFAGLNLINVANTNFIDSNYLLVTLNAFRNVAGDIVFPGLSNFFRGSQAASTIDSQNINNSANITNLVDVNSNTGNNTGGENSTIQSGDAHSSAGIFNQINTSLSGGDSISILLRIHGTWLGEVFGIPAGVNFESGTAGQYYLTNAATSSSNLVDVQIYGTSTASIHNDVSVLALTGNNDITGAETALISTGNAYAGANLVNIANANVIGRNWTLAIINIFGDFTGNLSFGRPDLWVGEQVDVPSMIEDGSELTYKFSVINNGDAEATRITLIDSYDTSHSEILESSLAYTIDDNHRITWDLGTLAPGAATEITYRARVNNSSPGTDITNTVKVTLRETDNNIIDNTDTATVRTTVTEQITSRDYHREVKVKKENKVLEKLKEGLKKLTVSRTTASTTTQGFDHKVSQELIIKNPNSTTINSIVLHDLLYDPEGKLVQDEKWEIADLLPQEEITLSYEIIFGVDAPNGLYTLSTIIKKSEYDDLKFLANGEIAFLPEKIIDIVRAEEVSLPALVKRVPTDLAEEEDVALTIKEILTPNLVYAASQNQQASVAESGRLNLNSLQLLFGLIVLGLMIYLGRRIRTSLQ